MGRAPEVFLDKGYSFTVDLYYLGNSFSELASYEGGKLVGPLELLFGGKRREVKNFKERMKTKLELTWKGADRYGPDFEKLLAGMMAYDPKDRLTAAEVVKVKKC